MDSGQMSSDDSFDPDVGFMSLEPRPAVRPEWLGRTSELASTIGAPALSLTPKTSVPTAVDADFGSRPAKRMCSSVPAPTSAVAPALTVATEKEQRQQEKLAQNEQRRQQQQDKQEQRQQQQLERQQQQQERQQQQQRQKQQKQFEKESKQRAREEERAASVRKLEKERQRKALAKRGKEEWAAETTVVLDDRIAESAGGTAFLQLARQPQQEFAFGGVLLERLNTPQSIQWRRSLPPAVVAASSLPSTSPALLDAQGFVSDRVLIRLSAVSLAGLLHQNKFKEMHLATQAAHASTRFAYVVEGVPAYLDCLRIVQSCQRLASSSSQLPRSVVSAPSDVLAAAKLAAPYPLTERALEEIQIWLQVERCQWCRTDSAADTWVYVRRFSLEIAEATDPLRQRDDVFTAFCSSPLMRHRSYFLTPTWTSQLALIPGISPEVADAIAHVYPTPRSLMRHYVDPLLSEEQRQSLLHRTVTVKRPTSHQCKPLGRALSAKLHLVFALLDGSLPLNLLQ